MASLLTWQSQQGYQAGDDAGVSGEPADTSYHRSPPQNVEARLLLSGYENFVTNQAKCTCRGRTDRTYYDAGKSSTYRAFDRFETDGYGDVVMSEDAATLAGRQIGAFPFGGSRQMRPWLTLHSICQQAAVRKRFYTDR